MKTPFTGTACTCRPGIARDNCPNCEGTGRAIDFKAFHRDRKANIAAMSGSDPAYSARVRQLEAEGMTTSDAQGVADAERMPVTQGQSFYPFKTAAELIIEKAKADKFGFLTAGEVAILAKEDRLRQLLIRAGGCRLVCAAQDVTHIIACLEAGGDYVRDVSIPAK